MKCFRGKLSCFLVLPIPCAVIYLNLVESYAGTTYSFWGWPFRALSAPQVLPFPSPAQWHVFGLVADLLAFVLITFLAKHFIDCCIHDDIP